jgi:hypothetical protein
MKTPPSKNFEHLLHPYIFVLKEGKQINHDFLDYSLLLLQVGQADVIPSPNQTHKTSTPVIQLLRR